MKFPSIVPGDHALILRAGAAAASAHGMQTRKFKRDKADPDVPYIVHPLRVAAMVANRTMDPHIIAAAIMHDVYEDTEISPNEVF
jgi:(p)ppGpp synthase/HD superfamily hydrolase